MQGSVPEISDDVHLYSADPRDETITDLKHILLHDNVCL